MRSTLDGDDLHPTEWQPGSTRPTTTSVAPRLLGPSTAMQQLVDVTAQICRRHGHDVDRAAARLALLTVVDHLDRALDDAELATLADALPLGLSLMVQRRARTERTQFDLVDEVPLRAACEALSHVVAGPLATALREEVADVLLARRPRASTVERSGAQRAVIPASMRSPSERPTVRVESTPEPSPAFAAPGAGEDVSQGTTRPPAGRRARLARAG